MDVRTRRAKSVARPRGNLLAHGRRRTRVGYPMFDPISGCSSMVEPQPSKLMMSVRSRSPAPIIWKYWVSNLGVSRASRCDADDVGKRDASMRRALRAPGGRVDSFQTNQSIPITRSKLGLSGVGFCPSPQPSPRKRGEGDSKA